MVRWPMPTTTCRRTSFPGRNFGKLADWTAAWPTKWAFSLCHHDPGRRQGNGGQPQRAYHRARVGIEVTFEIVASAAPEPGFFSIGKLFRLYKLQSRREFGDYAIAVRRCA